MLDWLNSHDRALPARSAVFYLYAPDLALEVPRQRIIVSQADFESAATLGGRHYRGVVPHLLVVLPARFETNGKTGAILDSFQDYTSWSSQPLGDFIAYEGHPR
jgi:hypothetical protein